MNKKITFRLLLLLLLMMGAGDARAAGYKLTLEKTTVSVAGYDAKAYYNFQTNTPAVLPTSGDLRYRDGGDFGLHNYGSGNRSAEVAIPVKAGNILILQQYSDDNPTTINHATKNEALTASSGYLCFDITEDSPRLTFTTPRYGGVIAVVVLTNKYDYTVVASDGTNVLGTLVDDEVARGASVTVAYPQYYKSGTTLYNIQNNGKGDWFGTAFTPNSVNYQKTLNYTNGTVNNVIYYSEVENIAGVTTADYANRASNGKVGHTDGQYVKASTISVQGAYQIFLRGLNGNSASRAVSFKVGSSEVYNYSIAKGTNQLGNSEIFQIDELGDLTFSSEGSSQSGLDWFYVKAIFAFQEATSNRTVGETEKPTLLNSTGSSVTYTSSNPMLASVNATGDVSFLHNGVVEITAKVAYEGKTYTSVHTITITGEPEATIEHQYNESTNTESYYVWNTGYVPENLDGTLVNMNFGNRLETQVAYTEGGAYCIDINGYTHALVNSKGVPTMGSYYVFIPKLDTNGKLTVNAYVTDDNGERNAIRLVDKNGKVLERITTLSNNWQDYTFSTQLLGGETYYVFAETGAMSGALNTAYSTMAFHAFTFVQSQYVNTDETIEIPSTGKHTIPNHTGMSSPSYAIDAVYGELETASLSIINGNVLSGITAGGAVRIRMTEGTLTVFHLITVAYQAKPYPGHLWDFNPEEGYIKTSDVLKTAPQPTTTVVDDSGDTWTARFKNDYTSRDPQWQLNRKIVRNNVLVVAETAGLLFNTVGRGFYLRNDDESFKHIGIYNVNDPSNRSSFTIPFLKAGDIVELNWKHDAAGSGSEFEATNLLDLRHKPITESFLITESQERGLNNHPGLYSFIVAADGDVTFTLTDVGFTDILSIRIYNDGYHSTMRTVNAIGNVPAQTTLLLDNATVCCDFNYCNQLYSTATGPAFYVLKGWRKGYDNEECVKGWNSAHDNPQATIENDDAYPAYPVTAEESERLYDLRKNLIGFRMYNTTWQSTRNSYNYGHIEATSGYGKVTIRMNNYTNDMKYLIGYTPDFTLTIGSAPHQTYPYTWDFTHLSGQKVQGRTDNVVSSIEAEGGKSNFSGMAPTNWERKAEATYLLNTDNNGEYGSQYVPGAVLVSQDRALSNYAGGTKSTTYALDEFDGLGFNGDLAVYTQGTATSNWQRVAIDKIVSLLSFKVEDYMYAKTTTTDEETGETIVTEWAVVDGTELDAGRGKIEFGAKSKLMESTIASGGFAYQCDGGESKYLKLILPKALTSGDIISVKAINLYRREAGVGIHIDSSESSATIMSEFLSTTNREETLTFIVGSELEGKSVIYLRKETNSVQITGVEVSGRPVVPTGYRKLYAVSDLTLTLPDLNADGKQDWIYVSASAAPSAVTNATLVTEGTDGPDANSDNGVYKYKVTNTGNANLTFAEGTHIYKIGVTHLLKEIHPVGGAGWATESRNHAIDHGLTGYFTQNDVNAYTVGYDSYDLNTATVALTPIYEDGYVEKNTGVVLKLDAVDNLSKANAEKMVPLFYPSYTRGASTTLVDFPTNNMMYPNLTAIRHYLEESDGYTKFILTNVHWTWTYDQQSQTLSSEGPKQAEAAGFYRLHIYNDKTKDTMADNTAYLRVPTSELPIAVWNLPTSSNAAPVRNSIGIRTENVISTDITPSPIIDYPSSTADVEVWYTLNGIRLDRRPTKPGLYICNGKKVMVR